MDAFHQDFQKGTPKPIPSCGRGRRSDDGTLPPTPRLCPSDILSLSIKLCSQTPFRRLLRGQSGANTKIRRIDQPRQKSHQRQRCSQKEWYSPGRTPCRINLSSVPIRARPTPSCGSLIPGSAMARRDRTCGGSGPTVTPPSVPATHFHSLLSPGTEGRGGRTGGGENQRPGGRETVFATIGLVEGCITPTVDMFHRRSVRESRSGSCHPMLIRSRIPGWSLRR